MSTNRTAMCRMRLQRQTKSNLCKSNRWQLLQPGQPFFFSFHIFCLRVWFVRRTIFGILSEAGKTKSHRNERARKSEIDRWEKKRTRGMRDRLEKQFMWLDHFMSWILFNGHVECAWTTCVIWNGSIGQTKKMLENTLGDCSIGVNWKRIDFNLSAVWMHCKSIEQIPSIWQSHWFL